MASHRYAIVGHSCRFPGGVDSPSAFWSLLMNGVQATKEIPERCFDLQDVYTESQERGRDYRRMGVRNAAVINDAEYFDAAFFGISQREARVMDPQQRKLLEVAHEAVEASGYSNTSYVASNAPETFGVYVAAATDDYIANLECQEVDVFYSPSTLRAFMAGRISHHFGWSGPSIVVDTACSSSLVALHTACRAIQTGDCRTALVAGVNIIASPLTMLGLWRGHFLSPDGKCKTYDASADGYGRAEGVAAFVVKKLEDAIQDQDNIEAVICGTALNQSGVAVSITHPHIETQHNLFQKLHKETGISPEQVGYVEMHGTGTKAGDRCEMASVTSVYGRGGTQSVSSNLTMGRTVPLVVGSVKANVGHAEAAAGFAGLCKLLGMFKHSQIPPQISLKTLNPELQALVEAHMVRIPTNPINWPRPSNGVPRVALLNSFGAAGSNASALLMEHVATAPTNYLTSVKASADSLFCLSSRTSHAMHKLIRDYLGWIRSKSSSQNPGLGTRLCYTTCARRIHHPYYRLAFPVAGTNLDVIERELASAAAALDQGEELKRIGKESASVIGFVSTRSTSTMRERLNTDALFKRFWEETVTALAPSQSMRISQHLHFESTRQEDEKKVSFLAQVVTLQTWRAWCIKNLRIAATTQEARLALEVATGALPLQKALEQIEMHTVGSNIDFARAPIYKLQTGQLDASFELSKSKSIVILTEDKVGMIKQLGTQEALESFIDNLSPKSAMAILATIYTQGAQIDFEQLLALMGQKFPPLPDLPLHSFAKDRYWVPYQTKLVQTALQAQSAKPIASVIEQGPDASVRRPTASPLPKTNKRYRVELCKLHSLPEQGVTAYSMPVREVKDEILGHKVAGVGMCPASVYHEMILASATEEIGAAATGKSTSRVFKLYDVQYSAPLRYDEAEPGSLICQLKQEAELDSEGNAVYTATVLSPASSAVGKNHVVKHAIARFAVTSTSEETSTLDVARIALSAPLSVSTAKKELYATFADKVVEYSELYQTIATLRTTKDFLNGEAILTRQAIELIQSQMSTGEYVLSPILQDTLLHACGYMAHATPQCLDNDIFIAQSVDRVRNGNMASHIDPVEKIAVVLQWDAKSSSFIGNTEALSANGRVLVAIDGVRFKKLAKRTFFSILNGSSSIKPSLPTPHSVEVVVGNAFERSLSDTKFSNTVASPPVSKLPDGLANVLQKVISTISQATGIEECAIKPKSNLEELGVDSLLFIELLSHLNKSLGQSFAMKLEEIGNEPGMTIADLVKLADSEEALDKDGRDLEKVPGTPTADATKAGRTVVDADYHRDTAAAELKAIEVLARILGMSLDELSGQRDATLGELGMDSLGVLELNQALRTEVGVTQLDVDSISDDISVSEYLTMVCPLQLKEPAAVSETDTDPSVKVAIPAQATPLLPVVKEEKQAIIHVQDHVPTTMVPHPAANWHSISSMDAHFLRKALRMEQNPVRIRKGSSPGAAPLFLCADGSGIGTTCCSLPVDQTRDIWILHHERMWDPTAGSLGIVEHAAMLVDKIESVHPSGGLIMGGWSFGGVLAWEVAYQLSNKSKTVRVLGTVAIDSPCPLDHTPLDETIIDSLMPQPRSANTTYEDSSHSDKVEYLSNMARRLIKASFLRSGAAMVNYAQRALLDKNTALGATLESNKSKINAAADIDLCLLRSRESYWTPKLSQNGNGKYDWLIKRSYHDEKDQENATLGWSRVGKLAMQSQIAGNHFTPFAKRNVASLSAELEKMCSILDVPRP